MHQFLLLCWRRSYHMQWSARSTQFPWMEIWVRMILSPFLQMVLRRFLRLLRERGLMNFRMLSLNSLNNSPRWLFGMVKEPPSLWLSKSRYLNLLLQSIAQLIRRIQCVSKMRSKSPPWLLILHWWKQHCSEWTLIEAEYCVWHIISYLPSC